MTPNFETLAKFVQRVDSAARIIDAHAFHKHGKAPSPRTIKRRLIATRKAADILRDELLRDHGR